MLQHINAISTRDIFTLWWSERWVRVLVFSLIPIGIVDAAFTLSAISIHGVEVEINPFVRTMISSGYWLAWALLNIIGFTLFCMLTGSYYLHTRTRISGPDTFWLSFIIALRVGMVGYNITFLYMPLLGAGVHPPFWIFLASTIITFSLINWLLNRETDISIDRTRKYFRYRLDGIHDTRLLRAAKTETASEELEKMSEEKPQLSVNRTFKSRFRKGLYIISSFLSFGAMLIVLEIIMQISGLMGWMSNDAGYLVFREEAGLGFIISFGVILFFLGLSMAFIFKAFDPSDEIPY